MMIERMIEAIVLIALVTMTGCVSEPRGNMALMSPNPYVTNPTTVETAIKSGKDIIPEEVSKMQYDGLSVYLYETALERNPDGTVYEQMVNGKPVNTFRTFAMLTKWNMNNTVGDAVESIKLGIGKMGAYARDGFEFIVTAVAGGIGADASVVAARGAAESAILQALGTNLEKHWLGKSGYLKVRNDGRVEAVSTVGDKIVGKLLMLTPTGAAGTAAMAVIEQTNGRVDKLEWEKPAQ